MNKLIVCNHKMFLTYDEALNLKNNIDNLNITGSVIICPNILYLNLFKEYNLGVQDCHSEITGAYTSMVSPYHLSLMGIKYSIVGHSDIRDIYDDNAINKKLKAVLNNSMTPILCIGETQYDRQLNKTIVALKKQLTTALSNVDLELGQELIVAYEPRWIINSNLQMPKEDIIDVFKYIKKILEELGISNYKILYGGNINKDNIKLIDNNIIDGYLLGHSSVDISELSEILKFTHNM